MRESARRRFWSEAAEKTAVFRTAWLLIALLTTSLLLSATPLRYQMLQQDVYELGDGLQTLGVSLSFFAGYFVTWELIMAFGSLAVATFIAWKRANDWFAILVAIALTLLGLLPPLVEGLAFFNPRWLTPIVVLRVLTMGCFMAVFSLFPNGRFSPSWTGWLLISWLLFFGAATLANPTLLSETAVLPNTRTLSDALWLLIGVGWFSLAVFGQIVRYRHYATPAEKQQMKWVLLGFTGTLLFTLIGAVVVITLPNLNANPSNRARFILIAGPLYLISALALPAAFAFSILRYRLWEVDVFLNRTLVYGGLTGLITAVYILLVGSVSTLTTSSQSNLTAVLLATLLVGVGIRPFYQWLQTRVDQFVPRQDLTELTDLPSLSTQNLKIGRTKLLRTAWFFNLALGLILFLAGLAVQSRHGFWQLPDFDQLTAVPALINFDPALQQQIEQGLYPAVLAISYLQAAIFVSVGLFLFWRKATDLMGLVASWLLIGIGIGFTPTIVFLPLLVPAWHIPATLFQIGVFGFAFLFLCLFPNGRFYPQLTRPVLYLWLTYLLLWFPFPQLNLHRAAAIWPALIFALVIVLGLGFQFWRYRRHATPAEKQQTKWVLIGFALANAGLFGVIVLSSLQTAVFLGLAFLLFSLAPSLIPLSIAIALLRHRLWNIDVILNRTIVYGGLTAVILTLYGTVVGGLSLLWRSQNNLLLSLLATGLIAILFQPARARLQQAANRLMFGARDEPYQVLSQLGRQLRQTAVPQQTLPAITQTICHTLKLPYAAIELGSTREIVAATGKRPLTLEEWPLHYQKQTVGWLLVAPRSSSESFTPKEQKLLADIATQAGAVAHAVRLTNDLQQSRERIVTTREEERRRLRRDLHDGLGPTLASQTFALDAAIDLLDSDPQAAAKLLQTLKTQNQETVADIRRLVYALRPPALDELGLVGALQAHFGKMESGKLEIGLTAVPAPLPPLSAAVEVAAYRIILEAVTNSVRHAHANRCTITIRATTQPAQLHLTIQDDGHGLPPTPQAGVGLGSMRERAEELGGRLRIENGTDGGVVITAVLPLADAIPPSTLADV